MSESSLGHPSPGPTKLAIDRPGVTWDTVLSGSPGKDLSPRCGRRKQKQQVLCFYLLGQLIQPLCASVPSCVNGNNA